MKAQGVEPDEAQREQALIAGARARGMFDAFAMTGQAAVLVGHDGIALAATPAARASFGASFDLRAGRIEIDDGAEAGRFEAALAGALQGRAGAIRIAEAGAVLRLRLIPVPAEPCQLLAAIVLIEEADSRVPSRPEGRVTATGEKIRPN